MSDVPSKLEQYNKKYDGKIFYPSEEPMPGWLPFASIGEGWHPLVEQLMDAMLAVGWDGQIHDIKEKFGGLRFYIGEGTPEVHKMIDKACRDSYSICEDCGAPGFPSNLGWIRTLCNTHHQEQKSMFRNDRS